MDLFSLNRENNLSKNAPLADRLRSKSLDEYFGQSHILAKGRHLRRLIESDRISSMILYGPPGTGKTTLAHIISKETGAEFEKLSAVSAGKKDIEKMVDLASDNLGVYNKKTILFIDEIHRFNKVQQDALLPHVENGLITLIGATTENPYINVNKALISRCQVIELKPLTYEDLEAIIARALETDEVISKERVQIEEGAMDYLIKAANGDARVALNSLEIAIMSRQSDTISEEDMRGSIQIRTSRYDRDGNDHYDTISAFIKSIRGSNPDAALYYLARMIAAGEDPVFIARRLVISASEDIGLADPQAMVIANAAMYAIQNIGMPEGRIPLAEATVYLALAPKSNSTYLAIDRALAYVRKEEYSPIPNQLKDSHYSGADKLGVSGYIYPFDHGGYVDQAYLPEKVQGQVFYQESLNGLEKKLVERHEKFKAKGDKD